MTHAPPPLQALPEEAVQRIISFLPHSAVKQLSLMSKDLCRLCTPRLFRVLDLARSDTNELQRIHRDLFEGAESRVSKVHFQLINLQILEEAFDVEPDKPGLEMTNQGRERQKWISMILSKLRSIKTVELELCLTDLGTGGTLHPLMQSALTSLAALLQGKADRVALWINSFDTSSGAVPSSGDITKLASILGTFPRHLTASLQLHGLHLPQSSDPLAFRRVSHIVDDGRFQSLELKECTGDFHSWTPPSLTNLVVSWGASPVHPKRAELDVALDFLLFSATTVTKLNLQDISGSVTQSSSSRGREALNLPSLRSLRLSYGQGGSGSLLDVFTSITVAPSLREVHIETEDIISYDLSYLVDRIPTLETISLDESTLQAPHGAAPASSTAAFRSMQRKLREAGIQLDVQCSYLRCDNPDELHHLLSRMRTLNDDLTSISLALSSASLGLDSIVPLSFPRLNQLSIGITDFTQPVGESDRTSSTDNALTHLLTSLDAPNLVDIKFTLFIQTDDNAQLKEIVDVLDARHFPALQVVEGMFMGSSNADGSAFRSMQERFHSVCRTVGLDSTSARFISQADLIEAAALEGEDGWETEEEDEDEWLDDQEDEGLTDVQETSPHLPTITELEDEPSEVVTSEDSDTGSESEANSYQLVSSSEQRALDDIDTYLRSPSDSLVMKDLLSPDFQVVW